MSNQTVRVSMFLNELAGDTDDALKLCAGERIPFVLVLQTDGVAQYVSNTERKDGAALIESLLNRWKAGRADIPAHYNPDLRPTSAESAGREEAIRWRAVTDELPDADETVLVCLRDHNEPVWLGFLDVDGWYLSDGDPVFDQVTHWAPMPGGPKA